MTNKPHPNVHDYRKEDFYWNDEDGIIPKFKNHEFADTLNIPVDSFKKASFVRSDGKSSNKIQLRMQDMDIEAELTTGEVIMWAKYLNEYLRKVFPCLENASAVSR